MSSNNTINKAFINVSSHSTLRLRGRCSLFKIVFGGVIIVLVNKSITTCNFTLLSVSVMISSPNDYWKPLLNCVGSLSFSKLLHTPWNDRLYYSSKKSILSPVQPTSATNINRIKYYLGPLEEILSNIPSMN